MGARILVLHTFFDIIGGGEKLGLSMARAFSEAGHKTTILTTTECSILDRLRVLLGENPAGIEFKCVKPSPLAKLLAEASGGRFERLRRLMGYSRLLEEVRRHEYDYDLVVDTQSNTLLKSVDIAYIHYPADLPDPRVHRGLHWRLYNRLVSWYSARLRGEPLLVLANSSWTAGKVYEAYRVKADVVHPPVDVDYFATVAGNDKREKLVVTVSRFTMEKRLERIASVAARLRGYRFILVGSTYKGSDRVLAAIEEEARRLRLDNLETIPDLPRDKLRSLLGEARYYLHPEFPEHFGIAVAEAMAAGAVPIVYRDGGAWTDIVSRVDQRLGYNSILEAAGIIEQVDSQPSLYSLLRTRSIEVARLFTYEKFKQAILEKVEYTLKLKNTQKSRV